MTNQNELWIQESELVNHADELALTPRKDMAKNIDAANDLPLMANAEVIRARHYMIRLEVDFSSETFFGEVIIFLEPILERQAADRWNVFRASASDEDRLDHTNDRQAGTFRCILDCCDIEFLCVQMVEHEEDEFRRVVSSFGPRCDPDTFHFWRLKSRVDLQFEVHKWCIEVSKENVRSSLDFPKVLFLRYKTSPQGKSTNFRCDQAGFPCVFTPAASINNRSLFPCQEPPIAMATWQAVIQAPSEFQVVCTGDQNGQIIQCPKPEYSAHYFYTSMVLPMSTFALGIGKWECVDVFPTTLTTNQQQQSHHQHHSCKHDPYPCHVQRGDSGPLIPARIFASNVLLPNIKNTWIIYIKAVLEAAYELLGSHPFTKVDILILPRSFSGLGLASPNLIFLSQTLVLNSDAGMLVRLAHEISHSWFGIVIGALDWTEEWLSEGFATFVEDPIHAKAMQIVQRDYSAMDNFFGYPLASNWTEISQLRAIIRFRTLQAELENTSEDLQKMRPMLGNELRDEHSKALFVRNGMNPDTVFTQVNYIKGYFLLRYLKEFVGNEAFFKLLRHYIHDLYHGKLVHSTDFLQLYLKTFKAQSKDHNLESVCIRWLNEPGMSPDLLEQYKREKNEENEMFRAIQAETKTWKEFNRLCYKRKKGRPNKLPIMQNSLVPEQIVLLLENLLEVTKIHRVTLSLLDETFRLSQANADILHRYCELIVKSGATHLTHVVKDFLINHQAMGVYLYGELFASRSKKFRKLATDVFQYLRSEMDSDFVAIINEMTSN